MGCIHHTRNGKQRHEPYLMLLNIMMTDDTDKNFGQSCVNVLRLESWRMISERRRRDEIRYLTVLSQRFWNI